MENHAVVVSSAELLKQKAFFKSNIFNEEIPLATLQKTGKIGYLYCSY